MKYIIMLKYHFNNSINTAGSTNNTITECHHRALSVFQVVNKCQHVDFPSSTHTQVLLFALSLKKQPQRNQDACLTINGRPILNSCQDF